MKTASEILCDLISFRTDHTASTNNEIVDYITALLKENDIPFTLIPTGNENNILAGINVSALKNIKGGIILSGHIDTVGTVIENWKTDPFKGTKKDGKIFGRGTMDMKYFTAVILYLLPQLKKMSVPILLAFTCDEETDLLGIRDVTSFLRKQKISPQYALVGEATNFKLAVFNRGYIGFRTYVQGVAGHAGRPELGINAIYIASKLVSRIEKLNQKYSSKGTTLNVGEIHGGTGRNSIPATTFFDWEIRYQNDLVKNKIIAEVETFCQKLKTEYSKTTIENEKRETVPAFEEKEGALLHAAETVCKTEKMPYPYASEAGFFQNLGIDTLICGAGDLKLAHTSNEYIAISDVEQYAAFLMGLLKQLSDK